LGATDGLEVMVNRWWWAKNRWRKAEMRAIARRGEEGAIARF